MELPIFPARSSCTLCELHKGVRSVGIPSRHLAESLAPAPGVPVVVFLGQNPRQQEDIENKLFVSSPGQLLQRVYITRRIRETATVYLMNTARCFTPQESPPRQRHYNACFPHTLDDLRSIIRCHQALNSSPSLDSSSSLGSPSTTSSSLALPRVAVVCLGAPAAANAHKHLAGKSKKLGDAFRSNGAAGHLSTSMQVAEVDAKEKAVTLVAGEACPISLFATFEPGAVLRKQALIHAVIDHMQLVIDWIDGTMATPSRPKVSTLRSPNRGPR